MGLRDGNHGSLPAIKRMRFEPAATVLPKTVEFRKKTAAP
jgi:hypothetical protein